MTQTSGSGPPASSMDRMPSKMAVTPALSSAERMVSPPEQSTSPRSSSTRMTQMPAQGLTVSMCAENATAPSAFPERCAMRLPTSDPVCSAEPSKVTVNPRSCSSASQARAISASCHEGLSISTKRSKSASVLFASMAPTPATSRPLASCARARPASTCRPRPCIRCRTPGSPLCGCLQPEAGNPPPGCPWP